MFFSVDFAEMSNAIHDIDIDKIHVLINKIGDEFENIGYDVLTAERESKIVPTNTRYSKDGIYRTPYGYYYPSSINIARCHDQMKQVKLKKSTSSPDYKYCYDGDGNVVLIENYPIRTTILCYHENVYDLYVGFEKITDESNETTLLLFKEYDDNDNMVSLLSVRWSWERNASEIEIEIYKYDGFGVGECSQHSYYITKPMTKEIERSDYQLTYENGQIVGWRQLTIE